MRAARLPTFKLLTPLLLTLLFLTLGCTARRVSSGRLAKEGFEPSVEGRHGLSALVVLVVLVVQDFQPDTH